MKAFWLGLAAASAAMGATAAQATVFTFDVQFWSGIGEPSANPDPGDVAHFTVDDYWGGAISNRGTPTGIFAYGDDATYFGQPYDSVYIDIYNDYGGGGFTFIPYSSADNIPDYDWELDLSGLSALKGSAGDYQIKPGVYNYDYYGEGEFRVTIAEVPEGAVPEPATWAMMLGGFGLMGSMLRRRARQSDAIA